MLILALVAFITYSYKQFDEGVKTPLTLLFIPKVVYKDAKSSFEDMRDTFKVKKTIKPGFVEINSPSAKKQREMLFPMLELTGMQYSKEEADAFSMVFYEPIEILEGHFPCSPYFIKSEPDQPSPGQTIRIDIPLDDDQQESSVEDMFKVSDT
jgi:hypothetical protein